MNTTSIFQTIEHWYSDHRIDNAPYWITQNYLYPKLDELQTNLFKQEIAGESTERRPIRLLTLGNGDTPVLIWTQMHGDEPTATRALLDILSIMQNQNHSDIIQGILNNLTLYILPMLNPDGAERFTRRTALGIDMNRDALALHTPEARILKSVREGYNIQWAYSLHDQQPRYAVGGTGKPAGISLLAAPSDWEGSITDIRRDAMRLITCIDDYAQNLLPGQIGKYDDAYEPRAFGDALHSWGTRGVLIESGYVPRDRYKETIRKVNAIAILGSLYNLAQNTLPSDDRYHSISFNRQYFSEYIFKHASISINGEDAGYQDAAFHLVHNPVKSTNKVGFKLQLTELGDCHLYSASYIFNQSGIGINFKVEPSSTSGLPEIDENAHCEIIDRESGNHITIIDGIPSTEPQEIFNPLEIR